MHVRNACVWFWRETRLLTQIFLRKIEHSPLMCLIYLLTLLSLLLSWQIRPVRAGIAEISVLDEEYAENGEDRYPTAFGIMMDAGSTGTRVYVYSWPKILNVGLPSVSEVGSLSITPGLATIPPQEVATYLSPLIDRAKELIDPSRYAKTPLFLRATAGMRVIPSDLQQKILIQVRNVFSQSGFRFQNSWASVISGQEEGAYAWIATNVILNTLDVKTSYGALDLGGSSTQITFIPETGNPPVYDHFPLMLNSQVFNLYTYSYLGYGQNLARAMKDDYLINNSILIDPCMNPGLSATISASYDSARLMHVTGSGNPPECRRIMLSLMNIGNQSDESIGGHYQPVVGDVRFFSISNYNSVKLWAGLNKDLLTVGEYVDAIDKACQKNINSSTTLLSNAHHDCFKGILASLLIHDAYKFPLNKTLHIADPINGFSATWALGAMLKEASLIEVALPPADVPKDTEYVIIIDAGSSGSRIYLYSWPISLLSYVPLVESVFDVTQPVSKKITPGLSSYQNGTAAANSLVELVEYVLPHIPENKHASTNVYLYATAGMRLLAETNPPLSAEIFKSCADYLSSTPLNFQESRIISGTEEGAYGWIGVNFIFDKIKGNKLNTRDTLAVLDLGGASTQISYVSDSYIASNDIVLTLGNTDFHLYEYSYLGYGNDQMRIKKDNYLIENNLNSDPCMNPGDVRDITHSVSGAKLKGVSGTGNGPKCREIILRFLAIPDAPDRSIGGNYMTPITDQNIFVGISAFYFARAAANLAEDATVDEWRHAANTYCTQNYSAISSKGSLATTNCFLINLASSLLTDAYRFPGNKKLQATSSNNGIEANWAIGAAIYKASILQYSKLKAATDSLTPPCVGAACRNDPPPSLVIAIVIVVVSLFILAGVILGVCIIKQLATPSSNGYQVIKENQD